MTYGIGRIPRDVDPTAEAMAELEAERIQPHPNPTKICGHCGRPTSELMSASHGSVCPDC